MNPAERRERRKARLMEYLGNDTEWPFVWDGTMGGKYTIGGIYFRLLAAVRDGFDILVLTPYGYELKRQSDGTTRSERMVETPISDFTDGMTLLLARDRMMRKLVKKLWQRETSDGIEAAYSVDFERFNNIIQASVDAPNNPSQELPPPRRTYVPNLALAKSVNFTDALLQVYLTDGRLIGAPIAWFPALAKATPEQKAHYEIVGGGLGLYWPELDEDVLVASLLMGADAEGWSQVDEAWESSK